MTKFHIANIAKITLVLFFFAAAINYTRNLATKPTFSVSKQDTAFNYSGTILTYLNAGNKRMISDLLWIQTLLESDLDHYKAKDLNSWLYLRFNTITVLDPDFYDAYLFGGQYLSIVKDDDLGAKNIYDKAVVHFPTDYSINFNAAFHYYFELGDPLTSAQLFDKIKYHPSGPSYLPSLTARLIAKSGDLESAFMLLQDNFTKSKDERIKAKLHNSMYDIRAELDLDCLNNTNANTNANVAVNVSANNKKSCNNKDLDGNLYINQNDNGDGKYVAQKKWVPFRPKK